MRKAPAAAATIDDYVAAFPKVVQQRLEALRRTIRIAAPEAVEAISYRIPAFKLDGRALIYFAGYQTHIGLYPVKLDDSTLSGTMEHGANQLSIAVVPGSETGALNGIAGTFKLSIVEGTHRHAHRNRWSRDSAAPRHVDCDATRSSCMSGCNATRIATPCRKPTCP